MTHKNTVLRRQAGPSLRPASTPFKLSPIAALVGGLTLLASGAVNAADAPSVAELQAEIARLRQIIATQGGTASAAPVSPTVAKAPASPDPGSAGDASGTKAEVAQKDEPQDFGEVRVRSRNRIERLQDVPISESVVTGKELDGLLAADLGAITKRAANVSWNQGNQRTSSLSIRGVGKIGQTEAQDPSVGIIADGVNYAYNPLSSFDFYDVDSPS